MFKDIKCVHLVLKGKKRIKFLCDLIDCVNTVISFNFVGTKFRALTNKDMFMDT